MSAAKQKKGRPSFWPGAVVGSLNWSCKPIYAQLNPLSGIFLNRCHFILC